MIDRDVTRLSHPQPTPTMTVSGLSHPQPAPTMTMTTLLDTLPEE